MWRYVKEAFFARPDVPGLGHFPANVLAVICFAILGFAHPGFWLLGIGLEAAFLMALATNRRFQRVVDAKAFAAADRQTESLNQQQARQLSPEARQRLIRLENRCGQVIGLYRDLDADDVAIGSNAEALKALRALYLKLLVAQTYLTSPDIHADEAALRRQVAAVQRELEHGKLPPALRESKSATADILQRRLQNVEQRGRSLAEIEADLNRIEAQVDLAVENAALRGQPAAISANVGLVSQLLDDSLYGQPVVGNGDTVYPTTPQNAERA